MKTPFVDFVGNKLFDNIFEIEIYRRQVDPMWFLLEYPRTATPRVADTPAITVLARF
jgi:hypothetical protein